MLYNYRVLFPPLAYRPTC